MPPRRRTATASLLLPFAESPPADPPPATQPLPEHELELGLDEAGRGPILGPMVLACVAIHAEAAQELAGLGVTDSKRFGAGPAAHRARLRLSERIYELADHVGVAVIDPREIDSRPGQLNHIEREHAARLIAAAPPCSRIVADGARLFAPLAERYPQLSAQDRAESAHVCVAAASIIAKSRRDTLWLGICERYQAEFGEFLDGHAGGGYPNQATRRFLRAYFSRYRRLPPEARKTWPTEFLADL